MTTDPYEVLGTNKTATPEELQKSYRRLAKKFHPDLNPGNKQAEARFKDITAAYDLLGDVEKRAKFDRGETDASGVERPQQRYYRDFAEANATSGPYRRSDGFADLNGQDNAEGLFAEMFKRATSGRQNARGLDVRYQLDLEFLDAISGGKRLITLADGSTLDVMIPAGTQDQQILRLRGRGERPAGDGARGDALVQVHIRPHPFFTRKGNDIHLTLPISLIEAVKGGKLTVPTTTGPVVMTIPKGSSSGVILRLKGKGAPLAGGQQGDMYVSLQIVLPDAPDPALESFMSEWQPAAAYHPRSAMEGQ